MNSNKELGNEHFKNERHKEALVYYKMALNLAKEKEKDDKIEKSLSNAKAFY